MIVEIQMEITPVFGGHLPSRELILFDLEDSPEYLPALKKAET